MTGAVLDRPAPAANRGGGAPARRAMVRWGWRLFRREWKSQALIMALLTVAVAATVVGLGVASNATNLKADPTFGTANTIISFSGPTDLAADVTALQNRFGPVEVIAHQTAPMPGSISTLDIRAEQPNGPYGHVMLRLDSGRYPVAAGEVALTSDVARTLGLHVGGVWSEGGRKWRVVGLVENPLNLLDQFALVAPGQANPPTSVTLLLNANQGSLQSLQLPGNTGLNIGGRGAADKTGGEVVILALGTLLLLFVGLLGVAGFTVMAQRRLRALGMLASIGATDRHIRLVMLANGAAVGVTAALTGAVVGLAAWLAFVPTLQSIAEHRVDRFALPGWAIAVAMLLTVVTAVAAAWWPARAVGRIPVVAALSGRPPRPQPAHRFAALGLVLLGSGLVLLAFADQHRAGFIIGGTLATAVGLLLLAPLAIRALSSVARRSSIAVRLALRDLARYQARSGATLGAVTLAVGIAATIVIGAAASQTPTGPGNLPANQMMLYLSPVGAGDQVPSLGAVQQQTLTRMIDQLGATLHANRALPLEEAYDPHNELVPAQSGPGGANVPAGYMTAALAHVTRMSRGESVSQIVSLYVATPAVLDFYGIPASRVNTSSGILSSRPNIDGLQLFGPRQLDQTPTPTLQTFRQLPTYGSAPGALITPGAMETLGLRPLPAAWLLQTPHPLTSAQIATAQKAAATAGLYVETRSKQGSLAPLRNWSTAAGILLALGVLGMTVGLIRSETANDLRTLAATGASSSTRRTLTGATAGALGLLGALLGTAGAYAALAVWYRSNLSPLNHVPTVNLVVILVGLPVIAFAGGWVLAGRQPPAIARSPLE